jgi:hypothetical protein
VDDGGEDLREDGERDALGDERCGAKESTAAGLPAVRLVIGCH